MEAELYDFVIDQSKAKRAAGQNRPGAMLCGPEGRLEPLIGRLFYNKNMVRFVHA